MTAGAGSPPAPPAGSLAAVVRWAPMLIWATMIFVLSSMSRLPAPPGGFSDKDAHFVTYGVLSVLFVWAITDRAPSRTTWTVAATAVVLAAIYGASDEWHQSFVPGRDVSALDLAADIAGATLAAVALRAWAIIRARR